MWIKVAKSCLRQKSVTWHTFEVELVLSLKQKVGRFCRWKFQVFCHCFTFSLGVWSAANLFEKGERVLRFATYDRCERAMIAAVEKSPITKGLHIVKGEYSTKTVRVILPNGDNGIYAFFEIDG